jgi:4-carboxymuconolactone decarboxylase
MISPTLKQPKITRRQARAGSSVILSAATLLALGLLPPPAPGQTAAPAGAIRVLRGASAVSSPAPAEYFTGAVRIDSRFQAGAPARLSGARVTFEAGARTAWHTHVLGQLLIVTAGVGRVQRWGDPVEEIRAGDIVWIPPGQKHWHGAAPDAAMTHIGVLEELDGKSTDWLEKVADAQYHAPAGAPPDNAAGQPTAAQRLMGDVAPKLAQLTDEVLFGDVWRRPQLSQRDRSLVTVAALIAMNRPDQLRFHLARARANGLTEEELAEVITHLAFYAGWPNALSAVGVAREVFQSQKR